MPEIVPHGDSGSARYLTAFQSDNPSQNVFLLPLGSLPPLPPSDASSGSSDSFVMPVSYRPQTAMGRGPPPGFEPRQQTPIGNSMNPTASPFRPSQVSSLASMAADMSSLSVFESRQGRTLESSMMQDGINLLPSGILEPPYRLTPRPAFSFVAKSDSDSTVIPSMFSPNFTHSSASAYANYDAVQTQQSSSQATTSTAGTISSGSQGSCHGQPDHMDKRVWADFKLIGRDLDYQLKEVQEVATKLISHRVQYEWNHPDVRVRENKRTAIRTEIDDALRKAKENEDLQDLNDGRTKLFEKEEELKRHKEQWEELRDLLARADTPSCFWKDKFKRKIRKLEEDRRRRGRLDRFAFEGRLNWMCYAQNDAELRQQMEEDAAPTSKHVCRQNYATLLQTRMSLDDEVNRERSGYGESGSRYQCYTIKYTNQRFFHWLTDILKYENWMTLARNYHLVNKLQEWLEEAKNRRIPEDEQFRRESYFRRTMPSLDIRSIEGREWIKLQADSKRAKYTSRTNGSSHNQGNHFTTTTSTTYSHQANNNNGNSNDNGNRHRASRRPNNHVYRY